MNNYTKDLYINTVLSSDALKTCYRACKCCYGNKYDDKMDIDKVREYIAARIKTGHESVIEHSNFIIQIVVEETNNVLVYSVLDFLSAGEYLRTVIKYTDDKVVFLIGGTIRAWKETIRNIVDPDDVLYPYILSTLADNLDPCFFVDFIEDGIMDLSMFRHYNDTAVDTRDIASVEVDKRFDSSFSIVHMDSYAELVDLLVYPTVYDTKDLYKMLSITIDFKNMSRAGTHQLVRHRNGITQSSMRYINVSGKTAYIPESVKDQTYELHILGEDFHLSYEDIVALETSIYDQLVATHNIPKEDARGILPYNILNPELYMTFTFMHLAKFLDLRTDKHAQEEIRTFATSIEDYLVTNYLFPEEYNLLLEPDYNSYNEVYADIDDSIDEVLEEDEEYEDDYEYSVDED